MYVWTLYFITVQKVYVAMDEPDGVAGVAAVRKSEPSLHEEIVEFESTGNIFVLYSIIIIIMYVLVHISY